MTALSPTRNPWDLTEAEIVASFERDRVADTPLARRSFLSALETIERAFHHMPKLAFIPLPVELAEAIATRPWTDAPTEEEAWVALTDATPGKTGGVWL